MKAICLRQLLGTAAVLGMMVVPARSQDLSDSPAPPAKAVDVVALDGADGSTGIGQGEATASLLPASAAKPAAKPAPVVATPPDVVEEYSTAPVQQGSPAPGPWHLPQPTCLQNMGMSLSGWLEQGITFASHHPASRFNGPVALNDRDGDYQMNQLWLALERPVKTDGCGWDIGGRVDALYGTDWRFGINDGLEDRINGFHGQSYGMVLPQAYVEVGINDLTVKVGHFAAILDYEIVCAPPNPFYSHSYSYSYTVPILVTGVLGDYKLNDQWSIQAGFDRGWYEFEDNNESFDFMGGIRWRSEEGRTNVAWAMSTGPQDPAGAHNRFVYSLVVKEQLTERFQYVLVHNLGLEDGTADGGHQAEWYGINQYFLYTINAKWTAGLRAEWLRDDDGVRVAGPGNIPGVRAWDGHHFAGNFYEVTAGATWRPCPNLMVRPELRYDWYSGAVGGYGVANTPGMPFNDGHSASLITVATDVVLLF